MANPSLGKHTYFAKQWDPVSTFTGSASSNAVVTIYAQPVPPAITSTTTPAQTKTTSPVTVKGTGISGYGITLYDGSAQIGTTTVASNGTWSLTVNLAVGIHALTATQTLVAAVTSTQSAAVSVTVLPPNPAAPTISAPVTATMASTAQLNGTGVAGNAITLYDGSTAIGSTVIASDGTWSLTVGLGLGAHVLTATQTDTTWNLVSVKSSGVTVTIYAQPVPPAITSISTPAQTKTTTPVTVKGTGISGETITLYDGSTQVGTATVASNGTWQITVNLGVGVHSLTATQTLIAAVTSSPSAAASVTVLPPNPAAPTLTVPVTATMFTSVLLSGTGVVGELVTVYDGSVAIGTTSVVAGGTWSLTVTLGLGAHVLTATQTDTTWNLVSVKSSSVTVTVYAQPAAPVITFVSTPAQTKTTTQVTVKGTGISGETITLYDGSTQVGTATVASNGTWQITVSLGVGVHSLTATQTLIAAVTSDPSAAASVTVLPPNPAAPTVSAPASATMSTAQTLSGTGVAGDQITLYDGATAIGTTIVASNGTWSLGVTLAIGAHTLSATQTDTNWNLTSVFSSTVSVTVYAQPSPPAITSASVGSVSHSSATVVVGGTGTAGETITVYDGSTVIGTATVAGNGSWTLSVHLASGSHSLTATQTLVAGVTSNASAAFAVTVPSH